MNMKPEQNRKFSSLISALAIGIAGSFLWEFLLSPLSHKLMDIAISSPARISSLIGNWYASRVASSYSEFLTIEIRMLLLLFLVLLLRPDIKKHLQTMPYICKVVIILIFLVDFLGDVQISRTASCIEHNIEIVTPYVTEQEQQVLKSKLYSMQTIEDFDSLNKSINLIATQNDLHLH